MKILDKWGADVRETEWGSSTRIPSSLLPFQGPQPSVVASESQALMHPVLHSSGPSKPLYYLRGMCEWQHWSLSHCEKGKRFKHFTFTVYQALSLGLLS